PSVEKKSRVEGHPGDNTMLGDIEFVPNDACIVDLRMGVPNEVLGYFGVSISIRAKRLTSLQQGAVGVHTGLSLAHSLWEYFSSIPCISTKGPPTSLL
ncbi:unnamed protein product, partial [Ilex paraguariensis]